MHKAPVLGTGLGLGFFFSFPMTRHDNMGLLGRGECLSTSDSRRLSLLPTFELSLSDAINSGADAFGRTLFSPSQP